MEKMGERWKKSDSVRNEFCFVRKYFKKIFEERKKWSTSVNVDLQYMGDSVGIKILNVYINCCVKFHCR